MRTPQTAYLTRTEEKKVRVCSQLLSLSVTVRVSLTFLRSALERLVLSFSRAETCLTLRGREKREEVNVSAVERPVFAAEW